MGKILQVLQMLEEWGPRLPFPYSSQVAGRLRELRIHYGRTLYRVFYYGDTRRSFILLHAFEKRSQVLPESEVRVAIKRMEKDQVRKGRKL
jgi:phage-related protein